MFAGVIPNTPLLRGAAVPKGWQPACSVSLGGLSSYVFDGIPIWANWLRGRIDAFPSAASATLSLIMRKGAGVDITGVYTTERVFGQSNTPLSILLTAQTNLDLCTLINTAPGGGCYADFDFGGLQSGRYKWGTSKDGTVDATFAYATMSSYRIGDVAPITGVKVLLDTGTFSSDSRFMLEYAA